ncbi:MAG: peptide ABC transporter substrate-binding protein [Verrucomicrobiae bacterium]|nr:peptide ABC transporter substrate-binding protein [Verrucomicrobiae bacterium]
MWHPASLLTGHGARRSPQVRRSPPALAGLRIPLPRQDRRSLTPHWARAALAFLCGLALLGCRPLPPADLTVLNGSEPSSLDPLLVTGVEELRAVLPLFEGLTRPDPVTSLAQPGLAQSWDRSPDGLRYTFHLRPGLVWSTGQRLTADDVVYSWRRVLEPTNACQYANLLFPVRHAEDFHLGRLTDFSQVGVRAPDPATVEVRLAHPCAYFLDLCAFQTLAIVPRHAIERHGDRWIMAARPLPSSGPYQLDFWRLNDRIRLRRNPAYWDALNTFSEVVDLLPVTAPNTALNLYLKGQADVIWDKPLVPTELMPALRDRPDFHSFPVLGTFFLRLNVTRPPFDDVRVRRAFALATDKPFLTRRITAMGEEPATHFVPTVTANYRRGDGQPYDPDAARAALAGAGFPDGRGFPEVDFLIDSAAGGAARVTERAGIELQAMWQRELGVRVTLRRMEKKAFLVAQRALDYAISRSSWIGDYNDPNTFLDLFMTGSGNNRTGWSHERYDQLLRAAAAESDPDRRATLMAEAETLLVRDGIPVIPLWFEVGFSLYRPDRLAGIHPNALDVHPLNAIRRLP